MSGRDVVSYPLYIASVPPFLRVTEIETKLGNAWYDQLSCCVK
jgi:hypothetical protein